MNALILFFICVIVHFIVITTRDMRRIRLRESARIDIEYMIQTLHKRNVLKFHEGKIKWIAILGSTKPRKTIIMNAGIHGLEYFSIQVVLRFLLKVSLNQKYLKNIGIQLMVIPIVNQYGYDNYKRTNENGVDLVRNSGYQSVHTRRIPFVSGWRSLWHLPLVYLFEMSWYYKGYSIEPEVQEYLDIVEPLIQKDCVNISLYDFHTGNNSIETTTWCSERDKREGIPRHLNKILDTITGIDYATDGGIFEYLAEKYNDNLNAFTVECAVLAKSGVAYYWYQFFLGSVFEPRKKDREVFLKRELRKMKNLIYAEYEIPKEKIIQKVI